MLRRARPDAADSCPRQGVDDRPEIDSAVAANTRRRNNNTACDATAGTPAGRRPQHPTVHGGGGDGPSVKIAVAAV